MIFPIFSRSSHSLNKSLERSGKWPGQPQSFKDTVQIHSTKCSQGLLVFRYPCKARKQWTFYNTCHTTQGLRPWIYFCLSLLKAQSLLQASTNSAFQKNQVSTAELPLGPAGSAAFATGDDLSKSPVNSLQVLAATAALQWVCWVTGETPQFHLECRSRFGLSVSCITVLVREGNRLLKLMPKSSEETLSLFPSLSRQPASQ